MAETLLANDQSVQEVKSATSEDIIAYLRRSQEIAKFAVLAESDTLVINTCEQLGIATSDEELQAAGDKFRLEYKLLGTTETLKWLHKQRISIEDWSQGIRVTLLTNKLKEHLFGSSVDFHYLNNRDDYRRVGLSQILVDNLIDALKVTSAIQEENASFCALALEYSKGKQSKENGGFVGIRFLNKLMPEIALVITELKAGEITKPVQTKVGYHILRVEKWFPAELSEIREQILDDLFQLWLQEHYVK